MMSAGYEGFSQEHAPHPSHVAPVIDLSIVTNWVLDTKWRVLKRLYGRDRRVKYSDPVGKVVGGVRNSSALIQLFRSSPF